MSSYRPYSIVSMVPAALLSMALAQDARQMFFDGIVPLGVSIPSRLAAGPHTIRSIRWGAGTQAGNAIQLNVPAHRAASLAPAAFYGSGVTASAMVIGDGGSLIVAGRGSVNLLKNNGDGTLAPPVKIAAADNPVALALSDFNGDGLNDIAVAEADGRVAILLNRGDGAFATATALTAGRHPCAIAVADFNGDGIPDLAVANQGSDDVSVFLGNGDGTFQSATSMKTGSGPAALVAADFNGDGIADLATANSSGNDVTILLGKGDGSFRRIDGGATGNDPAELVTADFNEDGNADLAVLNRQDGTLNIFLGRGDGTFRVSKLAALGASALQAGDLNGDGHTDLIVAISSLGAVKAFNGVGDGSFQEGWSINAGREPGILAMADFNGDGTLDIAGAEGGGSAFVVLAAESTASSSTTAQVRSGVFRPVANSARTHPNFSTGTGNSLGTVQQWGSTSLGEGTPPASVTSLPPSVSAISSGFFHNLALKSDGTVVQWGATSFGEGAPPVGLSGVIAISAGFFHSLVLKNDGTVVQWGDTSHGQGAVPAGLNNVIAISAGLGHNLALKNDGTVVQWGDTSLGQGAPPVGLNNVAAISAGGLFSLALKNDGTVVQWGDLSLREGAPPAGLSGVIAIAAGSTHSLVLKNDGTVVQWGDTLQGQGAPPAGLSNVVAISGGGDDSMALKGDGTVVRWGDTSHGQTTPPAGLSNVVAISNGGYHSLALVAPGALPGLPTIAIEAPAANAVLPLGTVTVTGWAIDNASGVGSAIASVQVKVDGALVGTATYGVSRPDVCNVFAGRAGCPNVGYTFQLNTATLTAGRHTVSVTATDTDGTPDAATASVTVTVSGSLPTVAIDAPVAGSVLSGTASISGWAIDNATAVGSAISSVQVKVDGVVVGNATYGVSRPDVCAAFPGRPGCPNVGYTFALNTATLGAGTHTITVSATDTDSTADIGTASVSVSVSGTPPAVFIDSPSPGATVVGTATVSGWAIDNPSFAGTPIGTLQVKVDGTVVGNATYGQSRPDVCAVYPGRPSCPNVGFTFALNTAALAPGTHMLTVTAIDTDIAPESSSWSVTIQVAGLPAVTIDAPVMNAVLPAGIVTVSGWAVDNATFVGTAIGSVQVKVDGALFGNATYGSSRPDVCAVFPGRPNCPNVGYTFQLNAAALQPGSHTITVTATDTDGTPDAGSASVTVTASGVPPTVFIDAPVAGSVLSGTATISGWAVDNASAVGTAISGVVVKVDGQVVGNATYGGSRPDVCAAFAGRPGCPNVGFSFALNTATLGAGAHTITVTATDSDGTPDVGTVSVNVTVAATPPAVFIDTPSPGATVSGTVTVNGWAIDNPSAVGTAIGTLQMKVDGTVVGNATYGTSRPDVCAAYPGRPNCPNVGFTFALSTAGLAPGTHMLTVTATDTDLTPDAASWSVTFQVASNPALPTIFIDAPVANAVLPAGMVTVSGWAVDNAAGVGTAIASVVVKVDGAVVGNATYGASRPDVCGAFPGRPGCPNVGYAFSLNAAALTPGTHTITVTATDSDGTPDAGTASVTVTATGVAPTVFIDAPVAGSVLSGTATISGWAVDNASAVGTAISGVVVKVDGTVVGNATYGLSRTDVCGAFPGRPGCPNVGFTFALNTNTLSAGAHTITVSATDTDGTPDVGTATVNVTVSAVAPAVFIDSPTAGATVSGTVTVSGWAIDNPSAPGTAIGTLQVKVDGAVVGNATYGVSRPDVCSAYPGRPNCPNVGFTFALNTAALTPGMHMLSVTATDTDGTPDSTSWSIAIQVMAPPTVFIDSPVAGATVAGTVNVTGWAIDNASAAGTQIALVQVKVDGAVVGNAVYGGNRADVCNAIGARPGCPNVGYTFALNTATLSAGAHTITVTATDSDGTPDVGSATVTVNH